MFCQFCGKELNFSDKVCSNCGAQVEGVMEENNTYHVENNNRVESHFQNENANNGKGPFKVFAIIGLALGIFSFVLSSTINILSFVLSIIPFAGLFCFWIPGMVFSILGIKSKDNRGKAITGLVFSSVALLITALYIVLIVIGALGSNLDSNNIIFD